MDKDKASRMLAVARRHVGDDIFKPRKFEDVDLRTFLEDYLCVVFESGFRTAVVAKHLPALVAAFHELDLDKIVAMDGVDAQTLPIRNQAKADAFLKGCRMINAEGWPAFRERVVERGRSALVELPWIGPATGQHLALILGIEDTEKADTWIIQCANACSATPDQMVTFLAREHGLTRQQVDAYLWQFCRDHQQVPDGDA